MSDRNRLLYTASAIGLIVLVIAANVIAFGYLLSTSRHHPNLQGAHPHAVVDGLMQTATASPPIAEHADSELRAQQIMAGAAIAQAFLTLVGLLLLAWTLHYTRRAVEEAAKATKAANKGARAALRANEAFKESSQRELRAYLTVLGATLRDTIFIEPGWDFILKVKNTGSTPAYSVQSFTYFGCADRVAPELEMDGPRMPDHLATYEIGPGQEREIVVSLVLEDIEAAMIVGDLAVEDFYVYGRIEYQDAFGLARKSAFRFVPEMLGADVEFGDMTLHPGGNESD